MRLAAKLILLFLFGLLLIVGLFSYLTIAQSRQLAIAEHERHAADLAATLRPTIDQVLQQRKSEELSQILRQTTRQVRHVQVRWVEYSAGGDPARRPAVPVEMIVTNRELTTVSMPDSTGREHLYTYVPVAKTGNNDAGIEISAPDTEAGQRLRRSLWSSLIAILGVAGLSGLVIWIGGIQMVGKPLEQLIEKVHRVGQGDFSVPVQVRSRDELGRLGLALNEMCDQLIEQRTRLESETASRIATVEQLRHADRLNTVGRMAAGIAHEIGTPLNVVSGRAELIAGGQLSEADTRRSAQTIQVETQRITGIVRNLLDFARQSTPNVSRQNVADLVLETVNLMQPLADKQNVVLKADIPAGDYSADIDKAQIQQVLTNLILNAIQASHAGGQVAIQLATGLAAGIQTQDVASGTIVISVRDQGSGISEADRQQIFEPFFTTKDVGDGTGLGLSISHGIVQEHGGRIDVDSEPGKGCCFSVHLPAPCQRGIHK